jgi:hypothetical protein
MDEERIAVYLEERVKSEAPKLQAQYARTAFNWMRFSGVSAVTDGVTFTDRSNSVSRTVPGSADHPFIMKVPLTITDVEDRTDVSIPLYYDPEMDKWKLGKAAFDAFHNIATKQFYTAQFEPDTFTYVANESCKDAWGFRVASGLAVSDIRLSGQSSLRFTTTNGRVRNGFLRMSGRDAVSEVKGNTHNWLALSEDDIERINAEKETSFVLTGVTVGTNGGDCKITDDITMRFSSV